MKKNLTKKMPVFDSEPRLNGIRCPECKFELYDSDPSSVLTSYPPKKAIHCDNCGYTGYRKI